MADKPYRLAHGYDQQGFELSYQDLMRMQMQVSPEAVGDVTANGNTTITNIYNTSGSGVPTNRTITTTAPLHGGGDLSADRSLTFVSTEVKLDDLGTPDDNTDLNSSTSRHGLLKKLDNDATHFMDGTGSWSAPTAGVPTSRTLTGTSPILIDGSNSAQALSADRTISIDLSLVPENTYIYGNGEDGALTLSGNTTLTAGTYIFNYTNVDLAGFTLTANEQECIIYINGTLTLNGGAIRSHFATARTGGLNSAGGGAGGTGGGAIGALWVCAKNIIGTGTISAAGISGSNGVGATASYGNTTSGDVAAQQSGTNVLAFYGNSYTPGAATNGTTGADGGASASPPTALQRAVTKNPMAWLFVTSETLNTSASKYYVQAADASAGGSGESGSQGWGPRGGAGGAGGCSPVANGGNGGKFSRVSGAGDSGATGGGGGGGSAGAVVIVQTDNAPSTLTVTARGGNGGNGGAASYSGGTCVDGQSSGGGGGGGGLAILVAQKGCTATVTATGGTHGTKGSATSGTANDGADGSNGRAFLLAR